MTRDGSWPETSVVSLPPQEGHAGASWFVWVAWALLLLLDLVFVGKYASKLPYRDDWDLVPVLTGAVPMSARYLWDQANEHRAPLSKLVLVILGKLSACDFRMGMFCNVLLLGGLTGAMIMAAKRIRGWTSYADAFFPLLILSLGQWECFLIEFALNLVASTVLAGIFLLAIVLGRRTSMSRYSLTAAVCLLLLPLCGANGVALVPALALWLGYAALCRRDGERTSLERNRIVILVLVIVAVLLVGLYFLGWRKIGHPAPSLLAAATTCLQFMTVGFGPPCQQFWPFSVGVVLCLLLGTCLLLIVVWRRQPHDRTRSAGLLLFLAACVCLGLAVGWGRTGHGTDVGFTARYTTLALPLLCCIYFIWGLYGGPRFGPMAQMCLFSLACALFLTNVQLGISWGRERRELMQAFEQDLRARMPIALLAERYADGIYPPSKAILEDRLRLLRNAGQGLFRFLPDERIPQSERGQP